MNIALFTESYKPYISGVTISVETLAKDLRRLGHRVYIFAPHYKGHKEKDWGVFRYPSSPTAYPGFRLAIPFSRKISKKISKLNLDIIHSHSPFQLGLLSRRFARKLKIPFVYTFHTLFDQYLHYLPILPKFLSKRILSNYLRNFCNSSDHIIAPSIKVKELLEKQKIKSKIEVVPTGVDFELAKSFTGNGVRAKHKIAKDEIVLLYVGRLGKEKNLPFLFEAFKLAHKKHKNTHLLLVARGPYESGLKKLAKKLGLSKRIIFAGQVKYPLVFDYYAASDIFVFASTTETQGLVLAEAKTSGLPIIAVGAKGVFDMVIDGEHGFLVEHDVKIFADKISHLIHDEELRKKMAIKAEEHAREHLSSHAYAKKVEKIYKSLLKP